MKNIREEFLGERTDPRILGAHEWLPKSHQAFDANRWIIDVEKHFPQLVAEEYQLLWVSLPYQLAHFTEAFEASRSLLTLPDDWDGNGGVAFSEDHWRSMIRFIADNVAWLWERRRMTIEAPEIAPGPGQTIDIHWQTNSFEMVVNIPADENQPVQFYGDDTVGHDLKGKLNLSRDNFWLFLWMA